MKTAKKIITLTFVFILGITILLAGCSNSTDKSASNSVAPAATAAATAAATTAAPETPKGPDTSKEVKLVGYLLGAAPPGMPDVIAELNKRLKKDINATVEINYIGWADLQSKYPLILASGEPVDFIFTADWAYYTQEAAKSAFLPLTDDMLQTYMPKHFKITNKNAWAATKVNGKGYMIPTSTPDRKVAVAIIRKDLREKYQVSEVTKLSELEPYLEAIKKNQPDMIPLNLDSQFDLSAPFGALAFEKYAYQGLSTPTGLIGTDFNDKTGKISPKYEGESLIAQKYAAEIMKSWYDKGYVNKNPYANKVRSRDVFCDGKSSVAFGNSMDIAATIEACKAKNIDVDIIPLLSGKGTSLQNSWLNNGVAIGANSKNAERTMMALDLMMEDPSYDNLVYFGVEGKNYVNTSDGKIGLPDGVTADKNTYPPDAAGFWFTNKDIFKPMASWTPNYVALKNKIKDYLVDGIYGSFVFNPEVVKTEVANVAQVSTQYENPIFIGAVKNVDEAIATLNDKLKAAGNQKIMDEVIKQTAVYVAANK